MLTFVVLDRDGQPWGGDDPARVTVRPRFTSGPSLPVGVPPTVRRRRRGAEREPTQAELERIADCVVGWDRVGYGGTPLPCTRGNLIGVLRAAPWIRRQVEQAITDASRVGVLR